tara:strand:- start:21 stop:725 length:705 start_codon:yes stop_codon:yes gene_type:complete
MDNHIINIFIQYEQVSFNDIILFLRRTYAIVDKKLVKTQIRSLIRKSLLSENDNKFVLTEHGTVVKNDNVYYHSRIIFKFLQRRITVNKKYEMKEIRLEQKNLRQYLIKNKKQICVICHKCLPLDLLETAHLKPRCLLNKHELYDKNIVEFMCRYCHKLYDSGLIGVTNGELQVSRLLSQKNYDLTFNSYKIEQFNSLNNKYFNFHYKYIFRSTIIHSLVHASHIAATTSIFCV